jgi:hypothetical protein
MTLVYGKCGSVIGSEEAEEEEHKVHKGHKIESAGLTENQR